jgi:energy-coupling factor transport system substrate-specific component
LILLERNILGKVETLSIKEGKDLVDNVDLEREKENNSVWLEKKSFRIAIMSTFSALAIVLGYLLAYIPNIELFTLTIFLSGFILGKRDGMIVGLLSSLIFCFFNPIGASPLPLLAFQLTHYSLTGLIGAITSDFLNTRNFFTFEEDLYIFPVMIAFGSLGAMITISFQFFSSLIDVLLYFGTIEEFVPYFISGIPFTIIHIIGNTLGFIFILPGIIYLVHNMLY